MVIVRNSVIPFRGYKAITIWPFIFVREEVDMSDVDMNHERIHGRQQIEMLIVLFFLWYLVEWLIRALFGSGNAYRRLGFEREAYGNEEDMDYLSNRKLYSWFRYLFNN